MSNSIFNLHFETSNDAIEKLQQLANAEGFSVRIRTSKPRSIYLVCSREGQPDPLLAPRKRQRQSERCHCQWRVVLHRNLAERHNQWYFRKSDYLEHNHNLDSKNSISTDNNNINNEKSLDLPLTPESSTLPSIHTLFPYLHLGVNYHPSYPNSDPAGYSNSDYDDLCLMMSCSQLPSLSGHSNESLLLSNEMI